MVTRQAFLVRFAKRYSGSWILLLACLMVGSGRASAALSLSSSSDGALWWLTYDPADGSLAFDSTLSHGISALQIDSNAGYFTGAKPALVQGSFDLFRPTRLFLFGPGGTIPPTFDLGPALTPGIPALDLANDLTVRGSCPEPCADGTLIYVPEPATHFSSIVCLSIALTSISRRPRFAR